MPRAARRADVAVLAVLACWDLAAAGLMLGGLGDRSRWVGSWWAVPFALAGLTTAVFAVWPRSAGLLTWSGIATVVSYAGRGLAIAVAGAYREVDLTSGRVTLTALGWGAFAYTASYLWLHVFKPAAGDRRRHPRRR